MTLELEQLDEYRQLLDQYRDALARRDLCAAAVVLEQAERVWQHIVLVEPRASPDQHVLFAFVQATVAGDSDEAKRLYDRMTPECQRGTDSVDDRFHRAPGTIKLWLRPVEQVPPFQDAVLQQSSPSRARAAAAYEYWNFEVNQSPSASAFESLGDACEKFERRGEALAAYQNGLQLAADERNDDLRATLEQKVRSLSKL